MIHSVIRGDPIADANANSNHRQISWPCCYSARRLERSSDWAMGDEFAGGNSPVSRTSPGQRGGVVPTVEDSGHRRSTTSGCMSLEILLMKSGVGRVYGEQRDGILGGSWPRKLRKT